MDRRDMLRSSLVAVAGASVILKAATPRQPEGPFHPINIDNDLRRLKNGALFAEGRQIEILGRVIDSKTGETLRGAQIEIWQADAKGKYAHPNDPLEVDPDPNFQFWGRTNTDSQGSYNFFSIKPGSYPAAENWERPPHIHLTIRRRGYHDLTTQLYFGGEELNKKDRLLRQVPFADRHKLIVDLKGQSSGPDKGVFDIELDPV